MSKAIEDFLKCNPILMKYAQMGLMNITSLSKYMKEKTEELSTQSVAAIGMEVRRYISQLPTSRTPSFITSRHPLNLVIRTKMHELIFTKNDKNRQKCLDLFTRVSQTKSFSCLVEGEKEIVLLTDHSLSDQKNDLKADYRTDNLGFISIDLPIKLREVAGVYNHITSTLAVANIPIHSFHTIGGEILILVKNEDLVKTQEVLSNSL